MSHTGRTEKRTQIYLSAEQHRETIEWARRHDVSLASVVREALTQYLASGKTERRVDWTGDPILELIGAFDLAPITLPGEELNDAIDRVVYDEEDTWSSPTPRASSQPSTPPTITTPKPRRHGGRLRSRAKRSDHRPILAETVTLLRRRGGWAMSRSAVTRAAAARRRDPRVREQMDAAWRGSRRRPQALAVRRALVHRHAGAWRNASARSTVTADGIRPAAGAPAVGPRRRRRLGGGSVGRRGGVAAEAGRHGVDDLLDALDQRDRHRVEDLFPERRPGPWRSGRAGTRV